MRHHEGRLNLHAARVAVVARALEQLHAQDQRHPADSNTDLSPERASDLAERMATAFTSRRVEVMQPFPGAMEALATFRARGLKLALITNGQADTQRAKVTRFDLESRMDTVLIEGELGFGKPDPRVYETAMARLGSTPETTWCIGDHLEWEVTMPQSLGLTGVWIDWAQRGLPEGAKPDLHLQALAELPDLMPAH